MKISEGNSGISKINIQKYQTAQKPARDEEDQFTISTAKKSSLKAKSICPRCQGRVNKQEIRHCEHCGSELCAKCLSKYKQKQSKMPL